MLSPAQAKGRREHFLLCFIYMDIPAEIAPSKSAIFPSQISVIPVMVRGLTRFTIKHVQ
jgi:hypothetical protein